MSITGILLAAGKSSRFGSDKLLYPLDGIPMAVRAARQLVKEVDKTLAIVRPDALELTNLLSSEGGLQIVACPKADMGMGASLACGVKASLDAQAWVIALADMPFIQSLTIKLMVSLLQKGTAIVAPTYQGRRGHPVGFNQQFGPQLSQLTGDKGARALLQQYHSQIILFPSQDAGIHQDIDLFQDLSSRFKF